MLEALEAPYCSAVYSAAAAARDRGDLAVWPGVLCSEPVELASELAPEEHAVPGFEASAAAGALAGTSSYAACTRSRSWASEACASATLQDARASMASTIAWRSAAAAFAAGGG